MTIDILNTYGALSAAAAAKTSIRRDVKEHFSNAIAYAADGNSKASDEEQELAEAGRMLVDAVINGTMSKDEVTAVIGEAYGFRITPQGKVSKTPEGRGNDLRKRIVRLCDTLSFVDGEAEAPRFLDGVERDDYKLRDAVEAYETGEASIWQAYNKLGEVNKKEVVEPALNVRTLGKIADGLTRQEVINAIGENPELGQAYLALLDELIASIAPQLHGPWIAAQQEAAEAAKAEAEAEAEAA